LLFVAVGLLIVYDVAVNAQDNKAKAGLAVWRNSACADCHGPFADGEKEVDEAPTGANIRTSRLDDAALRQVIGCGRAGSGMPAFDEGAYTVRPCYGQALGPAPDNLYPTPRKLKPDEIDAVVSYLRARIIGRGRITLEECLSYYDDQEDLCEDYK
jgi:mono/diheme cytochrome c family protein